MKGDRLMLLVIFLNMSMSVFNFLMGDIGAGLGWMAASLWAMRCHGLNIRIERMRWGSEEGEKGQGGPN